MASRVIDVEEVQQLMSEGVTYVDVRTPQEFFAGHVPGSLNIPLAIPDPNTMQMVLNPEFLETIQRDFKQAESVIIACKMGGRSRQACMMLEQAGFDALLDFSGGWSGRNDPFGQGAVAGWATSGLPVAVGGSDES